MLYVLGQVAGRMGMNEQTPNCRPVLLEPVMAMDITTPEEQLGEVIGDINQKRGIVELMTDKAGGVKNVKCQVPLASLFNYISTLRSLTRGRGNY